MNILIVGNGSTSVENESGKHYITNNTGNFLKRLDKNWKIYFLQFQTIYNKDRDIVDFELNQDNLRSVLFDKKQPITYLSLVKLILKVDKVYIFFPGKLGQLVGIIAKMLGKPYGLYVRGEFYNNNKIDEIVLKGAKFIITISPSFVADLKRFCSRVEIMKPMINIEPHDLKKNRIYSMPQHWNLLFVGRVEERKGIKELLEIVSHLKKADIDLTLNIVGGGDSFDEINSQIIDMGIQNEVVLHGLVSEKAHLRFLYDSADVFIFTSHDEGFPRVLYEAMASGLPIFTTMVGGISGRMQNLKNCIEIPVKNGHSAGAIVQEYLKQEEVLKYIGINGQQTVEHIIDGTLLSHEDLLIQEIKL